MATFVSGALVLLLAVPVHGQGLDKSYAVPKDVWLQTVKSPLPHTLMSETQLPTVFDWRNIDGRSMVTLDLNQHTPKYCGSCYLHAAISTLSDRLKIAKNSAFPEVLLSRQEVINCATKYVNGCQGGSATGVFRYIHEHGVPDETCMPYASENQQCDAMHQCMNCDIPISQNASEAEHKKCYPVQRYTRYFVSEYGAMSKPSIHEMKAEIFSRGPIACSVDCAVLRHWPRGTVCNKTQPDGAEWDMDHEISVAGWGVDDVTGIEYWVVRNSWGTPMGDNGWHRVGPIGSNALGIETDCSWAVMQASGVTNDFGPDDSMHNFSTGKASESTGDATKTKLTTAMPSSEQMSATPVALIVLALAAASISLLTACCCGMARARIATTWANMTSVGSSARLVEVSTPAQTSSPARTSV